MEAGKLSKKEQGRAKASERLTESIFTRILAEGAGQRRFRPDNIGLTEALIKAMLQDWYLKRWKYRESGVSVETYSKFVIDFVLEAISAPAGRKQRPVSSARHKRIEKSLP